MVEVEGFPALRRACVTQLEKGWVVNTNTARVRNARRELVELILSDHDADCLTCIKNSRCELQDVARIVGIKEITDYGKKHKKPIDTSSVAIVRDPNKCILCGRCISVCSEIQTVNALTLDGRGFDTSVSTALNQGLGNSSCVNCGQCTVFCPVGALYEKSQTEEVWKALNDPDKHVVVQEAPAIRAQLGEEFGMAPGTIVSGKLHAALRRMRFDAVFDTNFTADLTIIEEGNEVVDAIKTGRSLPIITSCSPGWIKFMETFYPHLARPCLHRKIAPADVRHPREDVLSGAEGHPRREDRVGFGHALHREEIRGPEAGDAVERLSGRRLRPHHEGACAHDEEAGLDLKDLPDEPADDPLGEYTGAATIFGATGGVMEAALRSAYFLVTGRELENIDILPVRGMTGVKEAEVPVDGLTLKVAVAHGLGNARTLLDKISSQLAETGKSEYHFVEIMACPGGCVGGGGQPWGSDMARRARRGEALYQEDKSLPKRRSHENASVARLYEKFLEKPNSEKAHHLLHTHYNARSKVDGKVVKEG